MRLAFMLLLVAAVCAYGMPMPSESVHAPVKQDAEHAGGGYARFPLLVIGLLMLTGGVLMIQDYNTDNDETGVIIALGGTISLGFVDIHIVDDLFYAPRGRRY